MDDSISENPSSLQGETPEQLADFMTQQVTDTLLPILQENADVPSLAVVQEITFRELSENVIDDLWPRTHDWNVHNIAKS